MISQYSTNGVIDGDILWIALERNGGAMGDTYNNSVEICNMALYALQACNGAHL